MDSTTAGPRTPDAPFGGRITRRQFARTAGLGWLAALGGCGASPTATREPPPGPSNVVLPEWWGARGDGITDDGLAFATMLASITHGTTIWLTRDRTYLIGHAYRMESSPESRALKVTGLRDLRITGGGGLKRPPYDPAHRQSTLLFLEECTAPVIEEVWIDGGRVAGDGSGVSDMLVFYGCTSPRVRDVRVSNSMRHGVNFTGCTDVQWSRITVENPRRYGVSHDASSGIVGSHLVCTGSAERAAVEFTNGCSDWSVQHVEANQCYLGGVLIGEHRQPGQSNRNGTISHVRVRGGDRAITLQGDTAVGNYNEDIRFQHVEVYDTASAMVRVGNGRRIHFADVRLVQASLPPVAGMLAGSDTSEITLERALIQGCTEPFDATRVARVTLREVAVRGCRGAIRFRGCDRVVAHDLHITESTAPSFLIHLDGASVPADTTLADLQRITGENNASSCVRVGYQAGRVVRRLVWLDNPGLTLDVLRPDGVDPVQEYVTDP